MLNGSHYSPPTDPVRSPLRRIAGLACAAVAVGATALLVVEVTGGSSRRPTLALVSHPAAAVGDAASTTSSTESTSASPTTRLSTSSSSSSSSTAAPSTTTTTPAPPLLPDGSPLPVLVVFNGTTITMAGDVPSEAAAARLRLLAEADSKTPAQIIDHLVVVPGVPLSVGVRVIEMNAMRFPAGSSAITADYAPELTRVINLMRAMPSVTTLVIGHADQTGTSVLNLQLSQARANAVIDYLVSQGISPDRLSAQGVGAQQPLTTQATSAGWALNRRTEFVFHGLFASTAR